MILIIFYWAVNHIKHTKIFWFLTFHGCKTVSYLIRKKIEGFIKIYDGIRYLVLITSERYNAIYNRIKYFISEKSGIQIVLIINKFCKNQN